MAKSDVFNRFTRFLPSFEAGNGRREWIDYAKSIAIIKVVSGHVAGGMYHANLETNLTLLRFVRSFDAAMMPLLFVVTGIFIRKSYTKRGFDLFVKDKFSTLLYPYFIWATIQLTIQLIGSHYGASNNPRKFSDYLSILYDPHKLDQFWFLYVLFFCTLLYAVLIRFFRAKLGHLLVLSIGMYILFYYLPVDLNVFGIRSICKFFFYLVLGDAISKQILDASKFDMFASWKTLAILGVPFFVLHYLLFKRGVPIQESDFFSMDNAIRLMATFSGIAFVFSLSFFLAKKQVLKWLRYIGIHTMYIYAMHIIVFGFLRTLLVKLFTDQHEHFMLYLIICGAVLIPIWLYKLLNYWGFDFLFKYPGFKMSKGNNNGSIIPAGAKTGS